MWLVLLVCAAPVLVSYLTYYVLRPQGRVNYGELIQPPRPLPEAAVTNLAGQAVALRSLVGQWLLVSVGGGACQSQCEQHLYLQRQLRESLGKDKDRLDWVWLIDDAAPVGDRLHPALGTATVLRVPSTVLTRWLEPAPMHQLNEHLYVVDPQGNWMLRWPAGLDTGQAAKAKRDLDRLLRASASWDRAGR